MSGDGAPQDRAQVRVWLDVPHAEKDEAKLLGARWHGAEQRSFAPPDRVEQLPPWAPSAPLPNPLPGEDRVSGSRCSST